jgi:hypothetical protein
VAVVILKLRSVPVLLSVIVILLGALLVLSVKAFAAGPTKPNFSSVPVVTQAHFVIPKGTHATWTLKLFSHGQLLDTTSGTSGTLSVQLPAAQSCPYQADVQVAWPKRNIERTYSGNHVVSACCPSAAGDAHDDLTTSVSSR